AFPAGRAGTLRVVLRREAPDLILLGVSDDGVGMRSDLEDDAGSALGWRLVQAFAEQLGANVRVSREQGTNVEVVFRPEG
ncbi:MAG TPA: ATP-binding protein, partial [Polyangiaceae bacterium]|nr:ATP-binding protein [Polyangiaceae bacterium]